MKINWYGKKGGTLGGFSKNLGIKGGLYEDDNIEIRKQELFESDAQETRLWMVSRQWQI